MTNAVVELKHGRKAFGKNEVLKDISLTVNAGDVLAVIGPSGGGKSTLLRCMTLLETLDAGDLSYGDLIVCADDAEGRAVYGDKATIAQAKTRYGLVFQNFNLFPHYTVLQNVTDALICVQKMPKDEALARGRDLLAKMGLADKEAMVPCDLSGGQQQRVAIARAVASNPKLLLLDEPLSNLDARLRIDMRSELQRIHRELGTTIIYVTHDQVEALTMSTKIALFKAGELSQVDAPMDLYMNPVDLEAADFIGNPRINFLEGTARYENGKLMVKCELSDYTFDKADMTDEPIPTGEFPVVVAIRPEQVHITEAQEPGSLPVKVYANQPAGSETLVSLQAGKSDFLSKQIGLAQYDIDQTVYVHIDPNKINIYDAKSTRLIKRAH